MLPRTLSCSCGSSWICCRSGRSIWRTRSRSRRLRRGSMSTQIRTVRLLPLPFEECLCLEALSTDQSELTTYPIGCHRTAAKAALRRKKVHEKNLEQTTAQIVQLEQQIYSIEAANINNETLQAMKQAGAAMSQIHGGMSIDKVDETMYVADRLSITVSRLYLLTTAQGQTPRTTPTQRGDRSGNYQCSAGRAARRGRAGPGTRGAGAGSYGRAHAQYGPGAGQRPAGAVTRGWQVGA